MQIQHIREEYEHQLYEAHHNIQELLSEKSRMGDILQQSHTRITQEQMQTQALQQE